MIYIRFKHLICGTIIFAFACLLIATPFVFPTPASSPAQKYKVLIDAGHGGIDGGAVGQAGTKESDLNLEYSKTLAKLLTQYGFDVCQTRLDENGLYDDAVNGFKLEDMRKRRQIIWDENPHFVISIHMNKFSQQSSHGAQVFYQQGDYESLELAKSIQNLIKINLQNTTRVCKAGDFYVLQNPNIPSVIVECGFISNPEEEKLLKTDDYRNRLCYNIVAGIIGYLLNK